MPNQSAATTSPDDSDITSDASAAEVKPPQHQWLQQQQQVLQAAWLRVKKSQGMEAVHEVRVAARRLRTVLKAWRRELHPLGYAELRFDLRNVGRLLAPTREADVRRRWIAKLLRSTPSELTRSANQLLAHLDQARAAERLILRDRMHNERWHTTLARIHAHIHSDKLLAVPRANANIASELQRFDKDRRRLLKACSRKKLSAPRLHTLRIEGKNIRYVGEALSELSGQDLSVALKSLRQLQDLLGDLHDCLQISDWCRENRIDPALMAFLRVHLEELQEQRNASFNEFRTRT